MSALGTKVTILNFEYVYVPVTLQTSCLNTCWKLHPAHDHKFLLAFCSKKLYFPLPEPNQRPA